MKKQNMFKAILFTLLFVLVLTWLIPTGSISGTEVVSNGLQRIGLYDIFEYSAVSFEYFANIILLIFGVGAFYGVLSKSTKYGATVNKIAKSLKECSKVSLVVITVLFAVLTSVCGFNATIFVFIPFFVSVLIAMNYDRMTAFLATFGASLVGNIGSIYNPEVTGTFNQYLSIGDFNTNLLAKIALFVVPMVIYVFFVLKYSDAAHKKLLKNKEENKDVFELAESKKEGTLATTILLAVLAVVVILAIIPWETVFGLEFFSNITDAILTFTVGGHPIFNYILGTIPAFGEYGIEEILPILAIGVVVISLVSKMKYQDFVDGLATGVKKVAPAALAVTVAHSVLAFVIYYPIFPTIEGWLINLVPEFNVFSIFTVSATSILSTLFNIEPVYIAQQALPMIASAYQANTDLIALIVQSMYGLTTLVAPTSILLVLGLEYLDIPYTSWLKTAWKTIVEILIVVLIILIALFLI